MDKKLVSLMIVFVLFFGLFTAMEVFNGQIQTFTRAAAESIPSSDKSLIFCWPYTIKADGRETATINVLIRNGGTSPLPIANKQVTLSTTVGKINNNTQITDKLGRANFTITSDVQGTAVISATVDGSTKLINTVSVKFE